MSDVFAAVLPELTEFSESSMPDSFTVEIKGTFVPDGHGGGTYAGNTTRGPYKCRLSTGLNEQEQAIADQLQQPNAQRMAYELSTVLAGSETGTATNNRTGEVFAFAVISIVRLGSYAAHRKALIRKVS